MWESVKAAGSVVLFSLFEKKRQETVNQSYSFT
jgi:hypothetical protein